MEILNIYTQKFGRNCLRHQATVLASHCTQTELSLSCSRDLIHSPCSLADVSTQTVSNMNVCDMHTAMAPPPNCTDIQLKINDAIVVSETSGATESVPINSLGSGDKALNNQSPQAAKVMLSPPPAQSLLKKSFLPTFPPSSIAAVTMANANEPLDHKSHLPEKNSNLVGQPTKEELRKKTLIDRLATMDKETQRHKQAQPIPKITGPATTSSDHQRKMKSLDATLPLRHAVEASGGELGSTLTSSNWSAPTQASTEKQSPMSMKLPTMHNSVAEKRKQELLAKLSAIDDEEDESKDKQNEVVSHAHPQTSTSADKDIVLLTPERIQNLHIGKPAHATEEDPFGSRVTASGMKKASLLKVQSDQSGMFSFKYGSGSEKPSFGRKISNMVDRNTIRPPVAENNEHSLDTPLTSGQSSLEDPNGSQDYFWENKIDIRVNKNSGVVSMDATEQTKLLGQVSQPESKVASVIANASYGENSSKPFKSNNRNNFTFPTSSTPEVDDLEVLSL